MKKVISITLVLLLVTTLSVSSSHAVELTKEQAYKLVEKTQRRQLERDNPTSSPSQIDKMLQDIMIEWTKSNDLAAEQTKKRKEIGIDTTATISTQTKMPGKMSNSDAASEIAALKQENAQLKQENTQIKLKISQLEKTISDILSRLLKAKI
jgi:hypothetical protein